MPKSKVPLKRTLIVSSSVGGPFGPSRPPPYPSAAASRPLNAASQHYVGQLSSGDSAASSHRRMAAVSALPTSKASRSTWYESLNRFASNTRDASGIWNQLSSSVQGGMSTAPGTIPGNPTLSAVLRATRRICLSGGNSESLTGKSCCWRSFPLVRCSSGRCGIEHIPRFLRKS
jgi:hypothetical protein